MRHFRYHGVHYDPREAANLGHGRLVDECEVRSRRVLRAEYVRDDLDGLKEVVVYEQGVREHEDSIRYPEAIFQWPCSLWLKMLNRVVRHITDSAAGKRGYLGYLDVFVDRQFPLKGEHGIALDSLIGPDFDELERIGTYEAVAGDILAREDRLEQKTILGVVCDAQIGDDGRYEVGGELNPHGHAIAQLFLKNPTFDVLERGIGR